MFMRFHYDFKYYIILSIECILILAYGKYLIKKMIRHASIAFGIRNNSFDFSHIYELFPLIDLKLEIYV